ncbi:MAG: homocysteine S-methyltransferase family protein [Lachnospiraceae bacterium]|nr:homocysteine S-methyltransferase family protein [Lachnospiraceae bacterium]
MTKQEFRELISERIVCLDGATGSNLQKRGMPAGVCPELWITEHEDILLDLQRSYVGAGSDIIYAPTFSGNRIKMSEYGLADRIEEINTKLVMLSRRAAGQKAFVAGDITMTGAQLEPLGDLSFSELYEVYREQIAIIAGAGADLLVVETMMSLQETRAAVLAARDVCPDLPLMATLSFAESGHTLYGTSAESAVIVLQSLGADAVGLNCSAGPDQMTDVVKRMKKVASVPLIAKPNAGLPRIGKDGQTVYDMDADTFALHMRTILEAGADIAGGCCGTTPEYIACLKEMLRAYPGSAQRASTAGMAAGQSGFRETSAGAAAGQRSAAEPAASGRQGDACSGRILYLADERRLYPFHEGQILETGEGIDFRNNEELLEEYAEDVFDTAQDLAFDLQDDGADALLFCAAGLDHEADILIRAIADVTGTVRMPVVVASDNPDIVRRCLTEYAGTAAVTAVSEDASVREEIENTAKLYGAARLSLDKEIRCC